MAFKIKQQRKVHGVQINELYVRIQPSIMNNGTITTSSIIYADKAEYENGEPINVAWPVNLLKQKYSDKTGEPIQDFENIAVRRDVSRDVVQVGSLSSGAVDILQMCSEAIVNHFVAIGFIANKDSVEYV